MYLVHHGTLYLIDHTLYSSTPTAQNKTLLIAAVPPSITALLYLFDDNVGDDLERLPLHFFHAKVPLNNLSRQHKRTQTQKQTKLVRVREGD